jgi:farnesyl diphosphate synthase
MDYRKGIEDYYPQFINLVRQIFDNENSSNEEIPKHIYDWIINLFDYNVPGGKMFRAQMLLKAVMLLDSNASQETINHAFILGWCLEALQASFLIADDIMDASVMRRGKPSWFTCDGVGMIAVNDAIMIQSLISKILGFVFKKKNPGLYLSLLELFLDVAFKTEIGQLMDLLLGMEKSGSKMDISILLLGHLQRFTMKNYLSMIKYKTAFYSFYLPVASAWCLVNKGLHLELPNAAVHTLFLLGEHFQIQDDYLDCYGDPIVIGKVGTDIQEGKCTWLFVSALEILNQSRESSDILNQLISNYGQVPSEHSTASISIVKSIYQTLKLKEHYDAWRKNHELKIRSIIQDRQEIPESLVPIFDLICDLVFERSK